MQHSRLAQLAVLLALFLSVGSTARAQTFSIDFETFPGGAQTSPGLIPADSYISMGVTSITVNSAFQCFLLAAPFASQNNAVGQASFQPVIDITFAPAVVSVTVDALDVGSGDVIMEAFNSSNAVIASQTVNGTDPPFLGIGNVHTVTVSAAGIVRVRVRQPNGDDGFLVDNLRYTRAVCGDGTIAPNEVCDDNNTDPCDGCNATCTAVDVVGCFIGATCIADGAANPQNACQVCDRDTDKLAYVSASMGSSCSDGQFCTLTEACDGNGACVVTGNRSCNDNLTCTNDSCDELNNECDNDLTSGCLIGGACIGNGVRDMSDCQACVPGTSTTAYSVLPAATTCDDTAFCSIGDACNGSGQCIPSGARDCADSLACTQDGCNETTNACEHPIVDGCLIAGQCVAQEAGNPNNNCQACIPTVSRTVYSPKPADTSCDDGAFCTVADKCNGSSVCLGTARDCNDQRSCTADSCDEAANQCDNDLTTGCLIGGVCVTDGASNPSNECQACIASTATGVYSNKASTAACNDSLFCTTMDKCDGNGACVGGPARNCDDGLSCTTDSCNDDDDRCERPITAGCRINNTCIPDAMLNPSNPCQVCNGALDQTNWSPTALSTSCDDGLFCTTSDGCNGAGSCVGLARDCSDAFSCTQDICNDTTDACENPLVAGCIIDGACVPQGQDDPTSVCRECIPTASTTAYSNRTTGDRCGDPSCSMGTQTPAPTCDANGECIVNPPVSCNGAQCADTVSCTGTCTDDSQCLTGYFCGPNGTCVPDGDDGDPCTRDGMCESMFCVDGVCCDGRCNGVCESCNQVLALGECTPEPLGTNPNMECPLGQICNGASMAMCIPEDRPNGQPCTDSLQCESGYCVDFVDGVGVCCDGACGGTCESCRFAPNVGMCTPHAVGEDPEMECGESGFCTGTGECASYETRGSGVMCSVGDMNEETRRSMLVMSLLVLALLLHFRRRAA